LTGEEKKMMKGVANKVIVFGIIMLFVGTSIIPCITGEIGTKKLSDIFFNQEIKESKPSHQMSYGDPPDEEWNRTFGGQNYDGGFSVKQTPDGGFIIAGYKDHWYDENGTAYGDGWLIKTNKDGNIEWDTIIEGEGAGLFYSIALTSDGGYIMTGITHEYNLHVGDVWLVKTDSTGDTQWNKTFDSSPYLMDSGNCVQQTIDGGYIITGYADNDGYTSTLWLIKTYQNGYEQWSKKFNGIWGNRGYSVLQTLDSGFIITGYKDDIVWLIKTDNSGNEQWNKTFGENSGSGNSIQQTIDGGYIITGYEYMGSANSHEVWLIKTNQNGDMQWSKTFGGTNHDVGRSVDQTKDGGYFITGDTDSFGAGSNDVWLIKTDNNGNMQWNKTFGGMNYDFGWCGQQTYDGGYIITGIRTSSADNYDLWLIKVKGENLPPEKPKIDGLIRVGVKIAHQWNFTSTDPNDDDIFYFVDWGDGTNTSWSSLTYNSGETMAQSHKYSEKGTYTIKAKAKDIYGLESDWGTLSVTMPCSYNIPLIQFWEKFLERFPHVFPILRHLMGYS
jgi:hypothetical protein